MSKFIRKEALRKASRSRQKAKPSRKNVLGLERIIAIASTLFGIELIIFSLSRVLWLSMLLIMLTGFVMVMQFAGYSTALQTIVEDDKHGRVMSFFIMASVGMMPFGSLLAGSLANKIGAPATIMIRPSSAVMKFGRRNIK